MQTVRHGELSPEPGIAADRVTYATEFGLRVPAIIYHPVGKPVRRPALMNEHGGDKYTWYAVSAGILFDDEMSVLPLPEWRARKDQFILESWFAKVSQVSFSSK